MTIATQVTNTPVHITSSSSGMSVDNAVLASKKVNSLDVKYEPALLSSAATGSINIDATSAQVVYHSSASANFSFNFRGNNTTTLESLLQTGQAITLAIVVNNSATPYYCTSVKIDGSTVTPKWAGGSAPSSGSASACDIYTFNILKLTSSPTYLVLATVGAYS